MKLSFKEPLKFGYFRLGPLVGYHLGFITVVLWTQPSDAITEVSLDVLNTQATVILRDRHFLSFNLFNKLLGSPRPFFYPVNEVTVDAVSDTQYRVEVGDLDWNRPFVHHTKRWLHLPMGSGYRAVKHDAPNLPVYAKDLTNLKHGIDVIDSLEFNLM